MAISRPLGGASPFEINRACPHNVLVVGASKIYMEQSTQCRPKERKTGLIPHGQPIGPTWLIVRKVGSNLVANSADCAGFADSINL